MPQSGAPVQQWTSHHVTPIALTRVLGFELQSSSEWWLQCTVRRLQHGAHSQLQPRTSSQVLPSQWLTCRAGKSNIHTFIQWMALQLSTAAQHRHHADLVAQSGSSQAPADCSQCKRIVLQDLVGTLQCPKESAGSSGSPLWTTQEKRPPPPPTPHRSRKCLVQAACLFGSLVRVCTTIAANLPTCNRASGSATCT